MVFCTGLEGVLGNCSIMRRDHGTVSSTSNSSVRQWHAETDRALTPSELSDPQAWVGPGCLSFPDSVKRRTSAFGNGRSLASLTIPDSVIESRLCLLESLVGKLEDP